MTSINDFESNVYSEELHSFSESEFDETMSDDWQGYGEWSQALETGVVAESENFIAYANGSVAHKPEPKSNGRYQGVEL